LTLEFALGVSAILTGLPIGVAVAHNWIAALLLLALLKLSSESSANSIDNSPPSDSLQ
jgi:heme A synthase